jgi:hypothetical protein
VIVFAPAYDEQTTRCLPAATHLSIAVAGALLLAGVDANRSNLLRAMQNSERLACFILSHGGEDEICGQYDAPALVPADLQTLPTRPVFAYACNSAFFGKHGIARGWVWWGYDKSMIPPPEVLGREDVESIFRYIAHRFHSCVSEDQARAFIDDLRVQCQGLMAKYKRKEVARMSSMVFFMQLWTRLRVWIPGVAIPVKHEESWSADLDAAI